MSKNVKKNMDYSTEFVFNNLWFKWFRLSRCMIEILQLRYSSTKWIKKYMGWGIPWDNYQSKSVMLSELEYEEIMSLLIPQLFGIYLEQEREELYSFWRFFSDSIFLTVCDNIFLINSVNHWFSRLTEQEIKIC